MNKMFRHFTNRIAHTISFSTISNECYHGPSSETIKSAMNSCFKIRLKQSRSYFGIKIHLRTGIAMSYFIKQNKLLVTNYHIIEELNNKKYLSELIIGDNPNDFKHKIVHVDPAKDLAFIEFDSSDVVTPNPIVQLFRRIIGFPLFLAANLINYTDSHSKFFSYILRNYLYKKLFGEKIKIIKKINEKNSLRKTVFAFRFICGNINVRYGDRIRHTLGHKDLTTNRRGYFKFIENSGNDDIKIIVARMFSHNGFSGGPLFDCNGELMGIIFAGDDHLGETLVISNEEILKELQKI